MTIHSSVLAWKVQWTEESATPQSTRRKELDVTECTCVCMRTRVRMHAHTHTHYGG